MNIVNSKPLGNFVEEIYKIHASIYDQNNTKPSVQKIRSAFLKLRELEKNIEKYQEDKL